MTSSNEGPYFVDERLNRSDIRSDPTTGIARPGIPLNLTVQLSQVSSAGLCTPLAGALVDMWHCDALGIYSDIAGQNSAGQRFLRGYQISDASGAVQFSTRARRDTTNARDGIYQSGGSQLLFPLSASGSGYAGTFSVGVRT